MADPSFDVVSKIDGQEVDNAVNQTSKELAQRFDFRGTNAEIEMSGEFKLTMGSTANKAKGTTPQYRNTFSIAAMNERWLPGV